MSLFRLIPPDGAGNLAVGGSDVSTTNPVPTEEEGHGGVGDFIKTVTTAGTAEQLASNACKRVIITALPDNTNPVALGASTVVASTTATLRGVNLFATQSAAFIINNTNLLFVDSVTNGEGISVYFES